MPQEKAGLCKKRWVFITLKAKDKKHRNFVQSSKESSEIERVGKAGKFPK